MDQLILCVLLAANPATVRVPAAPAKLVVSVLNAFAKLRESENEETTLALESALNSVFEKNTRASDEALAVLVEFYIGEHSGEDLFCELVHRGKRVLPLMKKYHRRSIVVPGMNMSRAEALDTLYDGVVHEIRRGAHCERES